MDQWPEMKARTSKNTTKKKQRSELSGLGWGGRRVEIGGRHL
jgi:hypothetical protein